MGAKVERKHRQLAADAQLDKRHQGPFLNWIETGYHAIAYGGNVLPLERTAQAIADAEARGSQARPVEAGKVRELADPLDACGYDQGLEVCEKRDGWLVITGKEGEDFRPVAFFFNRERADQYCELEIDDGCGGKEHVAFDACALEASIARDRIVCANDFDLDTHEKLRARVDETLSLADGEPAPSAVQGQAWEPKPGERVQYAPASKENTFIEPACRGTVTRALRIYYVDWDDGHRGQHESAVLGPLPPPPAPEEG